MEEAKRICIVCNTAEAMKRYNYCSHCYYERHKERFKAKNARKYYKYKQKLNETLERIEHMATAIPRKDLAIKLAWLAGIIDGEGSISMTYIKKRKKVSGNGCYSGIDVRVGIANTNLPLMREVADICTEIIGEKISINESGRKTNGNLTAYSLNFTSRTRAYPMLKMLLPYLIAKKGQAEIVINYFENRKPFARVKPEELEMCEEVKRLNKLS